MKKSSKPYNGKKHRIIIISAAIVIIICIFAATRISRGTDVKIAKEDYPLYGSAEQNDLNGWVQLTAKEMDYLCSVSTSVSSRMKYVGSMTETTEWAIYTICDDAGNSLILRTPEYSTSPMYSVNKRFTADDLPLQVFGKLGGTVGDVFKDYTGSRFQLGDYWNEDVITLYADAQYSWQSDFGATVYVRNAVGTLISDILYVIIIIAVLILIYNISIFKTNHRMLHVKAEHDKMNETLMNDPPENGPANDFPDHSGVLGTDQISSFHEDPKSRTLRTVSVTKPDVCQGDIWQTVDYELGDDMTVPDFLRFVARNLLLPYLHYQWEIFVNDRDQPLGFIACNVPDKKPALKSPGDVVAFLNRQHNSSDLVECCVDPSLTLKDLNVTDVFCNNIQAHRN